MAHLPRPYCRRHRPHCTPGRVAPVAAPRPRRAAHARGHCTGAAPAGAVQAAGGGTGGGGCGAAVSGGHRWGRQRGPRRSSAAAAGQQLWRRGGGVAVLMTRTTALQILQPPFLSCLLSQCALAAFVLAINISAQGIGEMLLRSWVHWGACQTLHSTISVQVNPSHASSKCGLWL